MIDALAALTLGGGLGCAMDTREIAPTAAVPSRGMTIRFQAGFR